MNHAREAIEILAERGWIKGDFELCDCEDCKANRWTPTMAEADAEDLPGVCLLGAYGRAVADDAQYFSFGNAGANTHAQLLALTSEVIKEQFPERIPPFAETLGVWHIPDFNDHDATTIDDIILVLEKVAVKLDEDGFK